jgi:hypothetical protein
MSLLLSPSGHHSTRVRMDEDGTAMLMPLSELGRVVSVLTGRLS